MKIAKKKSMHIETTMLHFSFTRFMVDYNNNDFALFSLS